MSEEISQKTNEVEQKSEEVKVEKPVEAKTKVVQNKPKTTITYIHIHSKANYNIPIKYNGQSIIIPPFGIVRKLIKERCQIDNQFAKYLTLIKA